MASHVVCVLLLIQAASATERYHRGEGLMDHLNSGIKLAQKLLGSESVALKVADFVVRAFNTVNTGSGAGKGPGQRPSGPHTEEPWPDRRPSEPSAEDPWPGDRYSAEPGLHHQASPWPHLIRLLGLQPSQLSAVAVNALVFVAQIITSFLSGPRRPTEPYRSDDPTDWILNKNSSKLQDIIAMARNESLPDLVEGLVADYGAPEEAGCIRLLVCKITPFVSRMQDAVFGKREGNNDNANNKAFRGAAVMYRHLPTSDEIQERGDICQKRFPDCDLNE